MNAAKRIKEILAEDGPITLVKKILAAPYWLLRDAYEYISVFIGKRVIKPRPGERYINIGGGNWYYPRWENVDLYAKPLYVDYAIDLRTEQKIPIEDECAAAIFSSHCLEHMPDKDSMFVLRECYRMCRPGGIIRIAVPDMDKAFAAYDKGDEEYFNNCGVCCSGENIEQKLANYFASYSKDGYNGGPQVSADEVKDKIKELDKYEFCKWCVSKIPEDAPYKAHVNAYDFDKMKKFLSEVGFKDIKRSEYRKSSVPAMRTTGFDKYPVASLYVEAEK